MADFYHDLPRYQSTTYKNAIITPPLCEGCQIMARHQADCLGQSVEPTHTYVDVWHKKLLAEVRSCPLCNYVRLCTSTTSEGHWPKNDQIRDEHSLFFHGVSNADVFVLD